MINMLILAIMSIFGIHGKGQRDMYVTVVTLEVS